MPFQEGEDAYNSVHQSVYTFERHACTVSLKVSLNALTAFDQVINGKYPDPCSKDQKLNQNGLRATQDMTKDINCIVFCNIVSLIAPIVSQNLIHAAQNEQKPPRQAQLTANSYKVSQSNI